MTPSISLTRPAAGLALIHSVDTPHMRLGLDFTLSQIDAVKNGQNLEFSFADGAAIILKGYFTHLAASALPTVVLEGGVEIPGPAFLASLDLSLLPPALAGLWAEPGTFRDEAETDRSAHSDIAAYHDTKDSAGSADGVFLHAAGAIHAETASILGGEALNSGLNDVILSRAPGGAFWPDDACGATGPVLDIIRNFSMKSAGGWTGNCADGGDFPDLRGLLQGVRDGSLDSYLNIEQDGHSAKVCIRAEPDGQVVQTIVLENVYATHQDEGGIDTINDLIRHHILLTSL